MSDPNAEQQATIIHQKITPQKVEEEPQKPQQNRLQPQLRKRGQSDVQSSIVRSQSEDSIKHNVNLQKSIIDEEPDKMVVEERKLIPADFYYPDDHQEDIHIESPIPQYVVQLDGFFGHDSFKRYNTLILDRDTIIISSGISYTIYNHFTKDKKVFYSKDKGGIAAIAVHPSKNYFAVAEKGVWPHIYIYEYPSLRLYRVLRKGTQQAYSSISFSHNGDMLASVGSNPDYLLNLWDWKQQLTILKSKAFSQQVYRVTFSQFNQNWLTSSGTGHIRFWKISQTFTGLKLQGQIAKFGLIELSDVSSYAQFEDGKVLSSSQYGRLLLWEGNLIKSVIGIDQNTPCHNGAIQYVKLHGENIISAGQDGFIKFWNYQIINQGQSDDKFNFYLKPIRQIYFQSPLKGPAYINWIEITTNYWIVQDALGKIWKYQDKTDKRQEILSFNSGAFNDFALSPLNNSCVTVGYDGFVRLWDYGNKRQFYSRNFATKAQATCIEWIPFSKKNNGRMLVVGFSDGIVRFLLLNEKNFLLLKVFKVHKTAITKVKANRQGTIIVVSDVSGCLFFISIDTVNLVESKPYCLFETGYKINDLCWDRNGQKILLGCQDGRLHEITVPKQSQCDISQTYLKQFQVRSFTIKMMQSQKPNKQDLQLELLLKKTKGGNVDDVVVDQQWEPAPILNAIYYDTNCSKVLCSVDGKFLGHYYIVDFNKERPLNSIQGSKFKTSYLGLVESSDLLLIGFRNGSWELRHKLNPLIYLRKLCYDQNYGVVRKIGLNLQNSALISISEDGTMISHKIDMASFVKGVKGDTIQKIQVTIPSVILGLNQASFADRIETGTGVEKDIVDNTIYSLQDQKLKAEEDMKLSEAQKIKNRKLQKIKELQQLFKQILDTNNKQTDYLAKLTSAQLIVDPQYAQAFQKRIQQQVQQTKKQLRWDQQYAELSKKKLEKYFVDQLESLKFTVQGIQTNTVVSSFKIKKLSPFVLKEIAEIQKIIQEQKALESKDKRDRTQSNFAQSKAILEMNKMKDGKKGKQENLEVRNKIKQAQAEFEKQLAYAIATKGDYKLKSSKDYMVPENQRLNVSRKKKHLFLHYQYLFMQKKQFNKRLKQLKHKKHQLIAKLESINAKLAKINKQLGVEEEPFRIQLNRELEIIQQEITVTQNQIAQHVIQKQRDKEASKKTGGMGMGGGQPQKPQQEKKVIVQQQKSVVSQPRQDKISMLIKPRANLKSHRSKLEQEIIEIKRIKLLAQKQKIKKQLQQEIKLFDTQLNNLRSLKYQLQNDLTLVEMKILIYSQQFIIFRDMEVYDNKLIQALNNFGNQKNTLQQTFIQLSTQINELETATQDIRKKYQDQKKILKQFVYPDDEDMRERIIRYYKIRERKRINKLKKQAEMEEKAKESQNQDSEEEDEEQQQQQDEDSQDQFEDQDQKPDITVIENDHKNFQRVRKICQYDQKIQENSRKKSQLERQRNQVTNKIKNITAQLTKAQQQLKIFQKKKLLKINQLIVSFPVKFSQIQYMVNINQQYRLHQDLSGSILFTQQYFTKLGERIQQLKKQKIDIQKKQKNLTKKLSKLTDSVRIASIDIQNKKKQYQQKQLLKFGSTFQLDRLKQLQPTNQVIQMRQLFKKQQRQVSNQIQSIKQQLQAKKRQLLQTKRQNTKVITQITQLGDRQNDLKKKLDSTNKQLFKNYDASRKDQLEKQRQNLKDLIKFLSKQIEDLKTQIGLFKRKGGHIYTMVTSNKKNFS